MRALPRLDVPRLLASARRFAETHLTIASALREPPRDPWVERILDGVGYLAGTTLSQMERLQGGLFHTVAETLAPEILRPTPSLCLVEGEPGLPREVEAGAELVAVGEGPRCRFRVVDGGFLGGWSVTRAEITYDAGVAALELDVSGEVPPWPSPSAFTLHLPTHTRDGLTLLHWLGHRCARMEVGVAGDEAQVLPPPERLGLGAEDPAAPRCEGPASVHGALRWYAVAQERFSLVRTAPVALPTRARAARLRFVFRTPPPVAGVPEVRLDRLVAVNLHEACSEPMSFDVSRGSAPVHVAGSREGGAYAVGLVRASRRGLPRSIEVVPARRLGAVPADPEVPLRYQSSLEGDGRDTRLWLHVATDEEFVVRAELLAHDGPPAGGLTPGSLRGAGLRSVQRSSPYVPSPCGAALARRVLSVAAVPLGTRDARDRFVEHVLLAGVPTEVAADLHDAFEARVRSIQSVEVRAAKRRRGAGVQRGCETVVVLDGEAFLGEGDVGLFGAALFASLRHGASANAFVRLTLSCPRLSFDDAWESA